MNTYEEKQEAKRERLLDRAEKARKKSAQLYDTAHNMADQIPFGQPILVGHHSEGRDRRFRGKITSTFEKSFSEMDKAEYYERKAGKVGSAGISSDDPEAVQKLKAQLASAKQNHEAMKAANAIIRKWPDAETRVAELVKLGFSDAIAQEITAPNRFGGMGFASFSLQNNSANMRRLAERIEALEKLQQRADVELVGVGYVYREDVADNRIHFVFEGKPDADVRQLLKAHGFKWSPSRGAWVRQLNGNSLYNARLVKKALDNASQP